MTTHLAITAELRDSPELSERDRAVAAGIRDAKAASTRGTYASTWKQFQSWSDVGTLIARLTAATLARLVPSAAECLKT